MDDEMFSFFNQKYKEALTEAAKEKKYVRTYGLNGTGKTTALIEFANENGHSVIVKDHKTAKTLREMFNYKDIYGYKYYHGMQNITIVVDDDVLISRYDQISFPIVTGYYPFNKSDEQVEEYNYIVEFGKSK